LDEPTVGMDPNQVFEMRELIRDLSRDRTILLSTHILPEVEAVCSRVLVIFEGRLVADEPMERLLRGGGGDRARVRAVVKGDGVKLAERLRALDGVESVSVEPGFEEGTVRLRVDCASDADPRERVLRGILDAGATPLEFASVRASLEEVFGSLTRAEVQRGVA
jgi:ABC-2 type transport system ATP-binding protein